MLVNTANFKVRICPDVRILSDSFPVIINRFIIHLSNVTAVTAIDA